MADDTFALPGSLSSDELLAALRNEEDLFFELTACRINPDTGENRFEFASTIYDDPPPALGDPDTFLKLHAFACAPSDAAACAQAGADFQTFGGGAAVWFGALRLAGVATFAVFYRGGDPVFPQPHVPAPADPALPFIPEDARRAFDPGGVLTDLPLQEASTLRISLQGLKDSVISYFLDGSGRVDALVMVTDAGIHTDGPRGSTKQDPCYQAETSLRYPDEDHTSCNSREFPGVVRSVRLRDHFKLKLGDLAYIYYRSKAVACQIYDQGPDGQDRRNQSVRRPAGRGHPAHDVRVGRRAERKLGQGPDHPLFPGVVPGIPRAARRGDQRPRGSLRLMMARCPPPGR